jgi:hypothetical protein
MMEAVRTSETSVDNHFTRQYFPEDNSEHHTRRRENLKSHIEYDIFRRAKLCHGTVSEGELLFNLCLVLNCTLN